ncbi:BLUF domain-containing protein [Acidimangrovimonas sediminis]|uniref:BLUF domain-containing protein n=1 Tax=Acidimangrovimonas sediminis TaxID=2056283 RepID=UPI0013049A97|nr:BLUF domain-containing protein [Acidimangrovimonas sediminis]
MEHLFTASYRSLARLEHPVDDIAAILTRSQERNRFFGITSLLLFDGRFFLQTIEGPARHVRELLSCIMTDSRHDDVVPFGISDIAERRFPAWQLKLIGPNASAQIAPDLPVMAFTEERLCEVHRSARALARTPVFRTSRRRPGGLI